jgi:hypothetical protein
MIQGGLDKKQERPRLQNNQNKRAGGVAQVAENLPSKQSPEFIKPQYCQKKKESVRHSYSYLLS